MSEGFQILVFGILFQNYIRTAQNFGQKIKWNQVKNQEPDK